MQPFWFLVFFPGKKSTLSHFLGNFTLFQTPKIWDAKTTLNGTDTNLHPQKLAQNWFLFNSNEADLLKSHFLFGTYSLSWVVSCFPFELYTLVKVLAAKQAWLWIAVQCETCYRKGTESSPSFAKQAVLPTYIDHSSADKLVRREMNKFRVLFWNK